MVRRKVGHYTTIHPAKHLSDHWTTEKSGLSLSRLAIRNVLVADSKVSQWITYDDL